MVNSSERIQYAEKILDFPESTDPDWRILAKLSAENGNKITQAASDRDLTLEFLTKDSRLAGLKIFHIKNGGICLKSYKPGSAKPLDQLSAQSAEGASL